MSKREKNLVVVAAIMIVLLLAVGGTYAYWTTTQVQEDENVINTTCLNVKLLNKESVDATKDTEGIFLDKAFPVSDTVGLATTGYTFTITNECNEAVNYDINIESLKIDNHEFATIPADEQQEAKTQRETDSYYLQSEYIKTNLTKKNESNTNNTKKLNAYTDVKHTYLAEGQSYEQKNLINKETLAANSNVTYTLKMWVDEAAPDTQMSKSYQGKIVIYSWLGNSNPNPIVVNP